MSTKRRSAKAKVKIVAIYAFAAFVVMLTAGGWFWNEQLTKAEGELPNLINKIVTDDRPPSEVVSDDGEILYRELPRHREYKSFDQIPQNVVNATMAAEDKRFLQHEGLDYFALGRILAVWATTHKASQGGSTLTMQVAKALGGSTERTLDRKIRNMALAVVLERKYSKGQIMEMYLNQSFFGNGAYGIAAAADVYFGKNLGDLSIAEAATLARCVRNPTYENPFANPEKAKFNRDVVLATEREEEWITEEQYQTAVKEELVLRKAKPNNLKGPKKLPYIVDYALKEFKAEKPDEDFSQGGYRLEITVDSKLQNEVEDALKEKVKNWHGNGINIGAFMAMDNEGRIQVMGNSTDYEDSQFNLPTMALLQPGSSFKPFVYSTAFEHGTLSPRGDVRNDAYFIRDGHGGKRVIRSEGPEGMVPIKTAVAYSYNRAAMWAQKSVGLNYVMDTARSAFGFTHLQDNIETTPLGSNQVSMYEMVQAYSVFQQKGDRVKPYMIKRVIGPDGDLLEENQPQIEHRVISLDTCEGIDDILHAVVEYGTGRYIHLDHVRGKTGTTSDFKDAWFCGYTNRWVGAVWLANQSTNEFGQTERHAMDEVMGSEFAAPLFGNLMQIVVDRYGDTPLKNIDSPTPVRVKDDDDLEKSDYDKAGVVDDKVFDPIPDKSSRAPKGGLDPDNGPPVDRSPIESSPPPKPPPDETDAPGNGKYVYVVVCSDSGQLATSKCPHTERLPFQKGTEPTERCQLHGG